MDSMLLVKAMHSHHQRILFRGNTVFSHMALFAEEYDTVTDEVLEVQPIVKVKVHSSLLNVEEYAPLKGLLFAEKEVVKRLVNS